jgi:hypothetical protein
VAAVLGRKISEAEARGMEERVTATMRRMASADPDAWRGMSQAQRLSRTAEVIAGDLSEAAARKKRNAELQVLAIQRNALDVDNAGGKGFDVIKRRLDQVDVYAKGVGRDAFREILDTIDFATKQDSGNVAMRGLRWLANLENPQKTLAFVRELFGVDSGDAGAKAAAAAWLKGTDRLRERFNRAGGDIRRLGSWRLPQPHDGVRIREAGLDQWVRDVLPLVDRSRYYDENGRPLTDAQMVETLEQMWRNLSTDGAASIVPGTGGRGPGAVANRHADSRNLHFTGPEAYVGYLGKYGAGSAFDAMQGHVQRMALDIALVEELGPNPGQTFRTMRDYAQRNQASGDRVGVLFDTEDMYRTLTGALNRQQWQSFANLSLGQKLIQGAFGQGARNVQVFGKLQGALLSSITDLPSYFVTAGFNRLPLMQATVNLVRSFGSESRAFADRAGLISESMISDMNRWAEGNIGNGWTGRLANATMKASFLTAWTDALRRGFSITMMGGMARLSRAEWTALDAGDRQRLIAKGWQPDEWAVVRAAELEDWRGTPMLTPAAIYRVESAPLALRERVASRLLGTIVDESEYASLNPDLTTRTIQAGGRERGTGTGELWRSAMLFKSFPIAMLSRHWGRVIDAQAPLTPASRLAYAGALTFGLTVFGALAIQLKDLAAGKDPRDMTGDQGDDPARLAKFWGAAFAQGGGGGFLADMLMAGIGRQGQSGATAMLGNVAGPVIGSASELVYDVGIENIREASQGKDTHAGAEFVRWLRGHTPAVNLWYWRLAVGDQLFHNVQEAINPGYLSRVQQRAQKEWGQQYWLMPGADMEPRAPDFGAAIGQ